MYILFVALFLSAWMACVYYMGFAKGTQAFIGMCVFLATLVVAIVLSTTIPSP